MYQIQLYSQISAFILVMRVTVANSGVPKTDPTSWYGTAGFKVPLNTCGHFTDGFTGRTTQPTVS